MPAASARRARSSRCCQPPGSVAAKFRRCSDSVGDGGVGVSVLMRRCLCRGVLLVDRGERFEARWCGNSNTVADTAPASRRAIEW